MNSIESQKPISRKTSKICMLLSGILMGNVGLLVTVFENSGYHVYSIVLLRGIFGTLFLSLFLIKSKSFSKDFLKESFKFHWKPLLIVGIINPLVIFFYFMNITISGYSIAAFLLYTSGIFVLVLLVLTKEEKVSKVNIVSFALAIIGVAIIMQFWSGAGFTAGIFFGLLSGITSAILILYKKKIYNARKSHPENFIAKGDFDTFLAWWPTLFIVFLFLPLGFAELAKLSWLDILFCLILGFFPTALAFTLYNVGVKQDKGGDIVILLYFEPVMATINTAIFLGSLSLFTIIGGSLILVANVVVLKYSK